MSDRLTYKQRLFVEKYLGEANGNAVEAARRAGYGGTDGGLRVRAARLLAKANIRAAIDARLDEAALSTSEILARLSEHATASLEHFITLQDGQEGDAAYRLDLHKARRLNKLHLVKKIRPTQHGIAIELHNPQAALIQLGKYRGLWDAPMAGSKADGVESFRDLLHGDDPDDDEAQEAEAAG